MKYSKIISFIILAFLLSASMVNSQPDEIPKYTYPFDKLKQESKSTIEYPYLSYRVHRNGRFWNTIMNNGIIGNFFDVQDRDLQLTAPDYYFPRYSRIRHAFNTNIWVGGVVDGDTLVTTARNNDTYWYWYMRFYSEFWPDIYPIGEFEDLSTNFGAGETADDFARSQIKYRAVYTDTMLLEDIIPYNNYDGRYHRPLGIEITQTSYSWSYEYAEDFLIIDYIVRNIGPDDIDDVYVGFYQQGANHYIGEIPYPRRDDIPGFKDSIPYEFEQLGNEPINVAWTIDVDGWPLVNKWFPVSTRHTLGIAPLDVPEGADNISFNWWSAGWGQSAWGPRKRGTVENPLRLFNGSFGNPVGDNNKYYMMAHPEIDYNGYYAAVDMSRRGWIEPFEYAENLTEGFFVNYVLSFGPFDLKRGEAERVTIVMSIGENVHTVATAYANVFDPENPIPYMTFLDFSDLYDNIRWAKRIYDNPGVDTDNDGDSGKYFFLVDTLKGDSLQIFYEGDGVPDFRGATPPPPPPIRVKAEDNRITVRWNGRESENYFDTFSLIKDFDGYRVYIARSKDENDITLLSSYDKENYNRHNWNARFEKWEHKETPYTIDTLKMMYGEYFEPLDYPRSHPLNDGDGNFYYFTEVDHNYSYLLDPNEIHKIYPDAVNDTTDVDENGRMRFYEYEYVIDNLLPTIPYYVSVTAFDFGYPAKSLYSLESSKEINRVKVFAINQGEDVLKDNKLNVFCYPNPYRIDAGYANLGMENRFTDLHVDRARTIYFANLPHKCTISIFSLDGDLIRSIEHDEPKGSGESAIERFDLITRNTQAIETGLYYWVVESEFGNQVGKFAIIK